MNLDKYYVSDFETTGSKNYKIENSVRVWSWNIRNVESLEIEGQDIDIKSFINWIKNKDIIVFFHNLKFDGQFIINELFKEGYKCVEKINNENEFTCLIDESGMWYSIEIAWKVYEKKIKSTKIYDSFKKIPLSVSDMSKAYQIDESKGSIDYDAYREIGYQPTKEEWDYISNDTLIVAKVLKLHLQEGMTKLTIASDSYNYFKALHSIKKWRYLFPNLSNEEHDFCRKSYKGGFVFVNKKFKNKILNNVISFDVNSLYPDRMKNCLLPYGEGKKFNGQYKKDERYPLYIQEIQCAFRINKDHIPTIQIKKSFKFIDNEYLESSDGEEVKLILTNIDLELFLEHYEVINLKYIGGYCYRARYGTFDEYIDHFYKIKQEEKGGKRQIAKLYLNSLYGKFGSARERVNMIPYYEDEEVKYYKSERKECISKYMPMATFITAYARYKTITSAQKFFNNFIYADTDSIHLVDISNDEVKELIEVDSSKLGAWKYEGCAEKAVFLRQKTYLKLKEGKMIVTCCGMPKKVKEIVNFENFIIGSVFDGKLQQKRVKGGVLLNNTQFSIKS